MDEELRKSKKRDERRKRKLNKHFDIIIDGKKQKILNHKKYTSQGKYFLQLTTMLGNDIKKDLPFKDIEYTIESGGKVRSREYEIVNVILDDGSDYNIRLFCVSYINKSIVEYTFYIV